MPCLLGTFQTATPALVPGPYCLLVHACPTAGDGAAVLAPRRIPGYGFVLHVCSLIKLIFPNRKHLSCPLLLPLIKL